MDLNRPYRGTHSVIRDNVPTPIHKPIYYNYITIMK